MNATELVAALKNGQRVYGSLIVADSPRWPGSVSKIGLDFVFLDTEHISLDRKELSWMCQIYTGLGLPPLVRIPSPDPYAASMVLDGGAAGVMVPYVETVEQVRALHGAVKLRPLKGKMLADVLEKKAEFGSELSRYQHANNGDNFLVINIESLPALENLEAILAEGLVDAVLIGPHDLSCSLGIPENYTNPLFEETVLSIIRRTRACGVAAGIFYWSTGVERELAWAKAGANFIIHGGDILAMRESLTSDIAALRRELGDKQTVLRTGADNI